MPYNPLKEHVTNGSLRETMRAQYNPAEYQYQKILGIRTHTGERKLTRLKPIHRRIIAAHLSGFSNRDVAFYFNLSEITISRVLRDPLSQEIISAHARGIDQELSALMPLGVDALRRGLIDDDMKVALSATDKLLRASGKYHHEEDKSKETAEDVIARALTIMKTQADSVNELVRNERPKALEVEFEDITPKEPLQIEDR